MINNQIGLRNFDLNIKRKRAFIILLFDENRVRRYGALLK